MIGRKSMKGIQMRRIVPLSLVALFGVSICLCGCAMPSWTKSKAESKNAALGITPPYERISQLREQRKQADRMAPQVAEQLAAQLGPQCGEEEDPLIRSEIVLTLGALNSESARKSLLAAGKDPNSKVRISVCEAWASIGDEAASNELARILSSDTDKDVRFAAAKALGQVGGPHAVSALGTALEDRDPAMQYLAMESLKQTSGQDYGHDVRLWKQYVHGETPLREEKSVAQRFWNIF